jgi:hypothetical protein
MEVMLVALVLGVVVLLSVRIAVGFVRWARANRVDAGEWALGLYLKSVIGDWVDGVNDSPGCFPCEHHASHGDYNVAVDHHGGCGSADGGSVCGE